MEAAAFADDKASAETKKPATQVLNYEQYVQAKAVFKEFDKNGDGQISRAELATMLKALHQSDDPKHVEKVVNMT